VFGWEKNDFSRKLFSIEKYFFKRNYFLPTFSIVWYNKFCSYQILCIKNLLEETTLQGQ